MHLLKPLFFYQILVFLPIYCYNHYGKYRIYLREYAYGTQNRKSLPGWHRQARLGHHRKAGIRHCRECGDRRGDPVRSRLFPDVTRIAGQKRGSAADYDGPHPPGDQSLDEQHADHAGDPARYHRVRGHGGPGYDGLYPTHRG